MLSAANSPDRRVQVVAPIRPFMTYRGPRSTFPVESFFFLFFVYSPYFLYVVPFIPVFGSFVLPVDRDVSGCHFRDNVIERFLVGLLVSMEEVSDRRGFDHVERICILLLNSWK